MLSQQALEKILGIEGHIGLTPEEMVAGMTVTFYPHDPARVSSTVKGFSQELEASLIRVGVRVIPYQKSLIRVPIHKVIVRGVRLVMNNVVYACRKVFGLRRINIYVPFAVCKNLMNRTRVRGDVSVVALGDYEEGSLPIDNTSSLSRSFVIHILDMPSGVDEHADFEQHFNVSMSLFSYHMAHIVLAVNTNKWILYNFNASHPTFERGQSMDEALLYELVPKVAAPIRPPKFSEFMVMSESLDLDRAEYKGIIEDFLTGSFLFAKTRLFPRGKRVEDLPFRNEFYKWIGKVYLDGRNGMSYGFLAVQEPSALSPLVALEDAPDKIAQRIDQFADHFEYDNGAYVIIEIQGKRYYLKVPDVWVLSQRSGCDKTNMDPQADIVRLGLVNGRMYMQAPHGVEITDDYRPSFDTRVILAHALGNALVASIVHFIDPEAVFPQQLRTTGMALAHWHGYIDPARVPEGWVVHGHANPHVACSTLQSALYALDGKLNAFWASHGQGAVHYLGDIHIEPHHGINMTYPTLTGLAQFLLDNPDITVLGNRYLTLYTKTDEVHM
jgi:hypothetical protein